MGKRLHPLLAAFHSLQSIVIFLSIRLYKQDYRLLTNDNLDNTDAAHVTYEE